MFVLKEVKRVLTIQRRLGSSTFGPLCRSGANCTKGSIQRIAGNCAGIDIKQCIEFNFKVVNFKMVLPVTKNF